MGLFTLDWPARAQGRPAQTWGAAMSTKTYDALFDALGQRESANDYRAVNQFGFIGRYQFGELALIDAGYYRRDGTSSNDFLTGWTGKNGATSRDVFLSTPSLQDQAARDWFERLDGYLTSFDLKKFDGQMLNGVEITLSGMLGGAHLVGIGGLRDYLRSGGDIVPRDGNRTPVTEYLQLFANFQTPFSVPRDGAETLAGGLGGDRLDGAGGGDVLLGRDGGDTLIGGAGADTLYGGAGNDQANGGTENDLIFGEAGADRLNGEGGGDVLLGGEGGDVIDGGDGADTALGEAGADQIFGGAGDDVLWGGGEGDTLNGGAGLDYLMGEDGADMLLGGDGVNVYVGGAGGDDMGSGFGLAGTRDTQIFYGDPDDGPSGGADSAMGGAATDWFILNGGADTMRGGGGNDMFYGGAGDDLIDMDEAGARGASGDYAWGGAGADRFVSTAGDAGVNVIMDFEAGPGAGDVLVVRNSNFSDFAALRAASVESNGYLIIPLGGAEAIYLWGVSKAQLSADDVLFG
jgi:serralysin